MADQNTTCTGCGAKFSTFKWKYQCHRCNAHRCSDCSSHKMPIPKLGITKPKRVCDPCYIALNLAQKNTADLEQFPVKTLKQFALDYNIPAALTNALEKSDIIAGLLKYYDPNQDKTHERAAKDREKKQKKKQKPSAAEYPGNVNTNQYHHSNSNANNRPQPEPHRTYSDSFFDPINEFFNGGSPQVKNNEQQAQNRPNNSNNSHNGNNNGIGGFFESVFNTIFTDNNGAHPFNPPQQQYQSANANTNVHYNNGAYNNNRGSSGSSAPYSNNQSQQQNSSYHQSNVNNTNYSNSNRSNGQSQQYSSQPQQQASRADPHPAPVGEIVIPENFDLNEMSVGQLKEILKRHRVDFKDCFEKSDLIQKIKDKIMKKTSDADKKPASNESNNTNQSAYNMPSYEKVGSEDKDICVICQDRHIKCVFLECGHLACCMECSVKVQHCPLCRKYISRVVEIYHAYK